MKLSALLTLLLLIAGCSDGNGNQGFAGLAASSDDGDYLQPRPGDTLAFPEDFGPHPQHRIEWW